MFTIVPCKFQLKLNFIRIGTSSRSLTRFPMYGNMSSFIIKIAQFSTQNELQIAVATVHDEHVDGRDETLSQRNHGGVAKIFFAISFTVLMAFHLHFMNLISLA